MAAEGDDSGIDYVLQHIAKGQPKALRQFALESLPVVFGEDALPHLREAMRGEADEGWHAAMQGFKALEAARSRHMNDEKTTTLEGIDEALARCRRRR